MSAAQSEVTRQALQDELDAAKSQAERNRLGQYATPTELALDILYYAYKNIDEHTAIRFIDPAFGTGSFYSALLSVFGERRVAEAVGYEVDPHYATPAIELWAGHRLEIRLRDFTLAQPSARDGLFNLLICNPPYVRHHHISKTEKQRLKQRTLKTFRTEISGLAGLYCYFLGLSHDWMADDGLAGWLIPSEFMDVNYGIALRHYLLETVTLLHIHRFDPGDVQFDDALVSSAIVWFRNSRPPRNHHVRFSFGGPLNEPKLERHVPVGVLWNDRKWTGFPARAVSSVESQLTLGDFFTIKRGLATGSNSFFILTAEEISRRGLPMDVFTPILPSPRYLSTDEVRGDEEGNPILANQQFLLDCRLPEEVVKANIPSLWEYLEEGKRNEIPERYLCRHREPWYSQEVRPPAPIVCTYMGRGRKKDNRLFRFILNNSAATATNVYLMLYPKPSIQRALQDDPGLRKRLWIMLNQIHQESLISKGRVYGGGLHKLEPKELANVPCADLGDLIQGFEIPSRQLSLL